MSAAHEDIRKSTRTYKLVFAALATFTALTVAVSYLHLPIKAAVLVALLIASIKGSLVAGWFMHLKAERKLIYMVLAITATFFALLLLWPLMDINGGTGTKQHVEGVKAPWNPHTGHAGGGADHGDGGH